MEHLQEERRHADSRLLRVEDKLNDQDKAITMLTGQHQMITYTLEKIQETLSEMSSTLKKQVDIEKQLVKYEMVEKDVTARIQSLEKQQYGDGCHTVRNVQRDMGNIKYDQEVILQKLDKISDRVKDIWIYGTIAVTVLSFVAKFALEHLFK